MFVFEVEVSDQTLKKKDCIHLLQNNKCTLFLLTLTT